MQETSLEAYARLKSSGALNEWQIKVFDYIRDNPGRSAYDCEVFYKPPNTSSVNARYSELRALGLISCVGKVVSFGTRRNAYAVSSVYDPQSKKQTTPLNTRHQELVKALNAIANFGGNHLSFEQQVRTIKYIASNALYADTL